MPAHSSMTSFIKDHDVTTYIQSVLLGHIKVNVAITWSAVSKAVAHGGISNVVASWGF